MSYFQPTEIKCAYYDDEWKNLLNHINNQWPQQCKKTLPQLDHPIEVKALYVFTIARRLMRTANSLAGPRQNWKLVFIEGTILLFPMLELVGHARLPKGNDSENLWAGLRWVREPTWLPGRNSNCKTDPTQIGKWQIGHLVSLRHFLLHGSKDAKGKQGKSLPIEDIISFEFPGFIIEKAQPAMREYWRQLKQDNGSEHWLERLAQADIRPLKIEGSVCFEKGVIDPDIVAWLEEQGSFL